MIRIVSGVQQRLSIALEATCPARLSKYGKVAAAKARRLHETMRRLLPQIRYWLKTGKVAAGKIVNIHIPELYAIVRGKVGKPVEFGIAWGMRRIKGGYLLATCAQSKSEMKDSKFAVTAVDEHISLFHSAPKAFGYDRAGHSQQNVEKLKSKGVRHIGLAPRGLTPWEVTGPMRDKLIAERAQIEPGIGTIKSKKYGFNKPAARSTSMMGACGQLAVLGFNVTKLVRELADRDDLRLTG